MTKAELKAQALEEAKADLRDLIEKATQSFHIGTPNADATFKPTIYTIIQHVSQSGMTRHITPILMYKRTDGEIDYYNLSWQVSEVTSFKYTSKNGYDALVVGGCGMDMAFHLVYNIARAIYGDGYAIKQQRMG